MATEYSVDNLIDFLTHAGDRGLMPAATAQALAVASRNVFGVLDEAERADIRKADLDGVIKRFTNKRAREFNPSSLKEYARRARRAVELFLQWRENPADFSIKTRATATARKRERASVDDHPLPSAATTSAERGTTRDQVGYQSAFPVRSGRVVTISNLPEDLTAAEADRLAQFIKMLAIDSLPAAPAK